MVTTPRAFFCTVAALLLAVTLLSPVSPRHDPFTDLAEDRVMDLDGLAVDDIAALKVAHLERHPPYPVLVTGNSRSLPLRARDLGVSEGNFFNASLTGESLRASILLLERLEQSGRLPGLAVLSLDHLELNYYSHPRWPGPGLRWRQAARDIGQAMTEPGAGAADLFRIVYRHMTTEAVVLGWKFNAERVWRGILWLRAGGDTLPIHLGGSGTHGDGSRTAPPPSGQAVMVLAPPNRNVLPSLLEYDLSRLAALQARGMRVLLVETLLHPDLHATAMAHPSRVAAESRAALISGCIRHRLRCVTAPPDYDTMGLAWSDAGHPPAPVFGRLIAPALAGQDEGTAR